MISFVIPAHNEEKLIGRTLDALVEAVRATGRPFEIIVVDDASDDATATIAEQKGARVVAVNRRQIAAVRNDGAKVALGDPLIFVDADTVIPVATLQAALDALDGGAVGGGSHRRVRRKAFLVRVVSSGFLEHRVAVAAMGGGVFCLRAARRVRGGWRFRRTLFRGRRNLSEYRTQGAGAFCHPAREGSVFCEKDAHAYLGRDAEGYGQALFWRARRMAEARGT